MKNTLQKVASVVLLLAFSLLTLPVTTQAAAPELTMPKITSMGIETAKTMLVEWNKIDGATGYWVYRKTSAKSKYVKVAAVDTSSYTDRKVRNNKTYYYRIRAVCEEPSGTTFSSYSRPVFMRMSTTRPTLTAKSAGASEVNLTWKSVKGADRYMVLTSQDKAATFKKKSVGRKLAYTKSGLTTGSRYYFKVRTYTKKSGVTYFGLPSVVKSATPAMSKTAKSTVKALVRLVNQERKKAGRSTLKTDTVLSAMALTRAKELSVQFSHDRPDGRSSDTVAEDYGYKRVLRNENIAFTGYARNGPPEGVMRFWKASPGHWDTIMDPSYEYVSAGYYEKGNFRYYVLLFATNE